MRLKLIFVVLLLLPTAIIPAVADEVDDLILDHNDEDSGVRAGAAWALGSIFG